MRAASLAKRAAVEPAIRAAFARRLTRLGPELARGHGARSVSVFWPLGNEIDTRSLLAALHEAGFDTALPVTGRMGTALTFRRWTPQTALVAGKMGIQEPPGEAQTLDPDLLFVPLAAFDRRGHRIGYGAGFYDRTLADLRARKQITAVGVAFADQEVLFIPSEDHDQPLDFVVTEKDTIVCADAG